jgi:hypothetical protein
MDCDFDNPQLTCPICGFDLRAALRGVRPHAGVKRNCTGRAGQAQRRAAAAQQPAPRLFKRLANFTLAAIRHLGAGSPTCDQATIDARLAICRECEWYRPDAENPELGTCAHADCGCALGREEKFLNKLAWADEACPLGRWSPTPARNPESP